VEERFCFPIPMTMQRHTGWRFATVPPAKPDLDADKPKDSGNSGLLDPPQPCESDGETRD
jgi:hypothetical protein